MIYNNYGKTGLKFSAVGFGGMRFSEPEDTEGNSELMAQAYQQGINIFDTAPGYCKNKSEKIFGQGIKKIKALKKTLPFYISCKTSAKTENEIMSKCHQSLKTTGLDCFDIYYMWCVMSPEDFYSRRDAGALAAFEKLKKKGLIRHIGISTHMQGADIKKILDGYPFDGVLLGYSVINFALRSEGVQAAFDSGAGVMAMNPLGGGIIPDNPELFSFIKKNRQQPIAEAALHFLFNDSRITTALNGINSRKHLDEAIAAAVSFKGLDAEFMEAVKKKCSESLDQICTGCSYCDHCPMGIPVPKLMDAANYLKLYRNPEKVLDRLRFHWGFGRSAENIITRCNSCGKCENLCTQKLPIRRRLIELAPFMEQLIKK